MRQRCRIKEPATRAVTLLGGRIPLVSLVQLLVVAEHLNFHHAANVLGISQSSVSTRIKALEETLGIVLFERRHRGVRLTEAGRNFVDEVAIGINQLDYAVKTANSASLGATGRLTIGLVASITGDTFANLRTHFRQTYPGVEQIVLEASPAHTIAMLHDGKIDVAFVLGPVEAPQCHSRLLWLEKFLVALPTAHPLAALGSVSWSDLTSETFLIRKGGAGSHFFEHVLRRMSEQNRAPRIRRCDIGRDMLMHLIAGGNEITLATEATGQVSWPGVTFRIIADEPEQARFSAVWSPANRSPALRNFLDTATRMAKFNLSA